MPRTVELRCPVGPKRLLSKILISGEEPHYTKDNLIEFACADCRRTLRKDGEVVSIVLHRYNFVGDLINSEVFD